MASRDLLFKKGKWKDEHFQKILEVAAANTNIRMRAAFDAQSGAALETLVKEHHVDVQVYPEEVMKKFREISKKVINEEAKKDPFALKVHEDDKVFKEQTTAWGRKSEKNYWDTMAQLKDRRLGAG